MKLPAKCMLLIHNSTFIWKCFYCCCCMQFYKFKFGTKTILKIWEKYRHKTLAFFFLPNSSLNFTIFFVIKNLKIYLYFVYVCAFMEQVYGCPKRS